MKRWFKTHLNELLLIAYLMVVWTAYLFVHHFAWNDVPGARFLLLGLAGLVLGLLILLVPPLLRLVRTLRFGRNAAATRRRRRGVFLLVTAASLLILGAWLLVSGQGLYSPDSVEQLQQASAGVYNDWHPVWHTLVFFTLPYRLTGMKLAVVLWQILLFSLMMGWMTATLYEFSTLRFALLGWCFVMLNPTTGGLAMHPWKDVGFSLAALAAGLCALRLWCAGEGDWARRPRGLILLGLSLANAALFRHNGILFAGFLLAALLFVLKRRQRAAVLLSFVLLFGAVKGPVYHLLDVEKPDQRVIETMGLPLTVIQNVVVQRPDALDEELSAFADAVAPREVWEEYYELGDFNRFKWKGADKDAIDAVGRGGLLRLMLHCFRLAPAESWQALFALTDMVYSVEGSPEDDNISPLLAGGDPLPGLGGRFDIRPQLLEYQRFFQGTALSYTRHIGLTLLALLTAALAECDLGRWQDWKKLLIVLSLFCYDFGTMLLLTGADYRFFYVSFPLCPVFLLLLLYDPEKAGPPTDA